MTQYPFFILIGFLELDENQEQTRKLAAGFSKHCFEVVDETDEVSNHTYGKAKLMRFEEIFEEY
ncbi:chlorohydrolase [Streptococcus pneumoniae]|nr:chlorohydrolase [Streptococcus pneumoniae]